jgi:hypothetical protein
MHEGLGKIEMIAITEPTVLSFFDPVAYLWQGSGSLESKKR